LNDFLARQVLAINELTKEQLSDIAIKGWGAMSNFAELQPKSAILGYAGSGSEYSEINTVPISEKVIELFFVNNQAFLWDKFSQYAIPSLSSSVAGPFFELLGLHLLHGKPFTTDQKESLGNPNTEVTTVELGGCTHVDQTACNLMDAAKETENVVFQSTNKTYPLIDFVYRKGNVFFAFQPTCGQTHDADPANIRELAKYVGGPQNLHLYFLVPSYYFDSFVTKPRYTATKIQKLIENEINQTENKSKNVSQAKNETKNENQIKGSKKSRKMKKLPTNFETYEESVKFQEKVALLAIFSMQLMQTKIQPFPVMKVAAKETMMKQKPRE
jgi:hypothetical protein